ncbi:DUF5696 domain-containing protein [Pseudogracilibacillus auburnensis]|uniref:DUF5696 domain-containing protein n=1 Tax=Pseudogracilibacillus auburnensis TaxID=1494959 RepID=UPI001A96F880|nr:DUF5696 domain-containing protein [Pseudogracilibacillus auburnensis]MBO1005132.1 hypothetical protein [Pseudogracilibacillus auburnensis]
MKEKIKQVTILFLCLMLMISLIPGGSLADDTDDTEDAAEVTEETESDEATEDAPPPQQVVIVESGELFPITATKKIAENDFLELYIDEETGNIRIKDKKSGNEWLGSPQLDKATLPNNKVFIESPVHIEYTDGASVSQTYTLKDKENKMSITEIESGARVDFQIEELKMSFAIEYILTDDGMEVVIPDDSVKENGKVRLTSLEVMPYFHAAHRRNEGAVFVPDGSGALMTIKEKHPTYFTGYSEPVYGPDRTFASELGDVMAQGFTRGSAPKERIALPVYGIYHEGTGFLGVITEGEETANINATPSGIRNIAYYRAGTEFFYRKQDVMFIGSSGKIPLFQGQRITGDRRVKFILLEDEEANYVGMANAYRQYLIDNQGLEKQAQSSMPLHIELVGGIVRDEIIGTTFIDLTTFEQAQSIIDDYAEKGVDSLKMTFKGWSKKGIYGNQPRHFPIERKLGGKKRLEQLAEHAKEKGVDLYLDANYVRPFEKSKGMKPRKDAVRGIDREVMKNPNYRVSSRLGHNGQLFYLLKPERAAGYAAKEVDKYKDLGVTGVHLSFMGDLLYSDQDPNHMSERKEAKEAWIDTIDTFKQSVEKVSVDYGYAYTLGRVDEIHHIPMDSSHFVYLDKTVPFYQIVIHGMIPYTGMPANLRNDSKVEFLRAIEYGTFPSFELTYKSTDNLKRTMEDRLFSSDFDYWFHVSLEEYEKIQEIQGQTANQLIVNHEELARNVYKTTYENGTEVIVNYNKKSRQIDGQTIEGLDYLIQSAGGE